jgi:hypothetical protein
MDSMSYLVILRESRVAWCTCMIGNVIEDVKTQLKNCEAVESREWYCALVVGHCDVLGPQNHVGDGVTFEYAEQTVAHVTLSPCVWYTSELIL